MVGKLEKQILRVFCDCACIVVRRIASEGYQAVLPRIAVWFGKIKGHSNRVLYDEMRMKQ